jgi:hypothetical protein
MRYQVVQDRTTARHRLHAGWILDATEFDVGEGEFLVGQAVLEVVPEEIDEVEAVAERHSEQPHPPGAADIDETG